LDVKSFNIKIRVMIFRNGLPNLCERLYPPTKEW
jgi:hypothetical protein